MLIARLRKFVRRRLALSSGTFVSFETHLTKLCQSEPINHVLEFGPGKSTQILLRLTDARLCSIESSREWFERYQTSFDTSRVTVLYQEPGQDISKLLDGAAGFDLIFIDGGDRVAALRNCRDLLSETGFVYLHDAHREEYESGIACYGERYFPERHSCILAQNRSVIERVRSILNADYSCRCKYCGSRDRQAYFSRMSGVAARP